jgi:hypothetical protein
MGKAAKAHRQKVAKRNAKIKQQKSAMQKAFDTLLKAQMDEMINKDNTKVQLGENDYNFEVLGEVNDTPKEEGFKLNLDAEESAKINKEFEEQPTDEDQQ